MAVGYHKVGQQIFFKNGKGKSGGDYTILQQELVFENQSLCLHVELWSLPVLQVR